MRQPYSLHAHTVKQDVGPDAFVRAGSRRDAEGVRAFAAELLEAQPGRSVRVQVLKGQHVMQVHVDAARYEEAIASLVAEAGMVSP